MKANDTKVDKFLATNETTFAIIGNDIDNTIMYGDCRSGQVLLGQADATGYKFKGSRTLIVGGILADSMRVALSSNWSDYVYDEDYDLMQPEALAAFISKNGHLPNIPAAHEVATNGIDLAAMNAKLLEKTEELTLYMLQQQEAINQSQQENTAILNKLDDQKRIFEQQQAQIDTLMKLAKQ